MKLCPTCQQTYSDETLKFCRVDGALLSDNHSGVDDSDTRILPARQIGDPSSARQFGTPSASIAVLPFVNMSADTENQYFCDGLAEELINALTKIETLRVTARTSAFSFKGKEIDVREIGRQLGVNTVLEGSVRKAGDRLRITAQLIDVADGYHLWSERYDRQMEDVFRIQDEISLAIVEALKLKLLSADKLAMMKRYTENSDAYQLYLQGRFWWNRRTNDALNRAIQYFEQAIEKDPTFALAYAGLGDCWAMLGSFGYVALPPKEAAPRALTATNKALELDDALVEARSTLALLRMNYDWDFAGAERGFKEAIQLNGNYPTAHHYYGVLLELLGRFEESLAEFKLAQQLDPLSPGISGNAGLCLYLARRYDQAIAQIQEALKLDPGLWMLHGWLAWAYELEGDTDAALSELKQAMTFEDSLIFKSEVARAHAIRGNRDEAQQIITWLRESARDRYVEPFYLSVIYEALGDKDQALAWLEKAYQARSSWMVWLKVDPRLDSLRSDARFQDLLRRVGLASSVS